MLRKSEEISDAGKQRVAEERKHGFKFSDILLTLHSHPFLFFFFLPPKMCLFFISRDYSRKTFVLKGTSVFQSSCHAGSSSQVIHLTD